MAVEIREKKSMSFGLKVGLSVILFSIVLGFFLRQLDSNKTIENGMVIDAAKGVEYKGTLLRTIVLPVPSGSREAAWTTALAKHLGGVSEYTVDRGRVDVLTDRYAIEIDFPKKWHEGIGQAIHYGSETNRISVLALIKDTNNERETNQFYDLVEKAEKLCLDKNIELIILTRSK